MRFPLCLALLAITAGCGGSATPDTSETTPAPQQEFATQLTAPSPDYAAMIAAAPEFEPAEIRRERTSAPPPDVKAVGELWLQRLDAIDAQMGHGLAGKGPDGAVQSIDTLLTASEFDDWVADNGWEVPTHISWMFQQPFAAPRVSAAAEGAVRVWPASRQHTGWQLEAAEGGRVFLRDGCLFVTRFDGSEHLAWLHAERGLDRDEEGYFVLVDRTTSQPVARLGEEMTWAAPNHVDMESPEVRALQEACGDHPVHGVGNPEANERWFVQYPHLRDPAPNPPPPTD